MLWERLLPAEAHAAWFHLKLGLVAFLLLPLEGMHAWAWHAWVEPELRRTAAPPFPQRLSRGLGMQGMVRALELPLLGAALPLLAWLSLARPFRP